MTDQLIFLETSSRIPAGLLTWQAWELIRSGVVYTGDQSSPQAMALVEAGVVVHEIEAASFYALAQLFRDLAKDDQTAIWLAGTTDDQAFRQALQEIVAQENPASVTLEFVQGSFEPPGAALLDVVSIMDRLRSSGGCPWDAQQTHETLMPYLLEEAYETYQTILDANSAGLREELGDLLLQIVFHARIAEEADQPFSIDDVANGLFQKLIRRHPHVFGDVVVSSASEVHDNWEAIKRAEKKRESILDDIPLTQPALLLAIAILRRIRKSQIPMEKFGTGDDLGHQLLALAQQKDTQGRDAEAALRHVLGVFRANVTEAEQRAKQAGIDPSTLDAKGWERFWPAPGELATA